MRPVVGCWLCSCFRLLLSRHAIWLVGPVCMGGSVIWGVGVGFMQAVRLGFAVGYTGA